MSIQDAGDVGEVIEFFHGPEGVYLLVKPGASKIPFERILAFARSTNIPRIDVVRLKLAWVRSDGRPVVIAPPVPKSAALNGVLRTEESKGEVSLVIDPSATALALSDVVEWLNAGHFSGLDLDLIRQAIKAPHGTPQRITRLRLAPEASPPVPTLASTASVLLSAADETSLAASATVLAQQGLEVRRSSGPEMAVFEATQHLPDVIVIDTSLGTAATIETCRQLSADPRTKSIPLLVSCREATRAFVSEALQAGARDLMVHPISAVVLTRKVTKVLEASGRWGAEGPGGAKAAEAGGEAPRRLGKIDLDKLVKQISDLEAIPAVVERVVRISGDAQAGAKELAQAVGLDHAATTLVLRVANSFTFGAAKKIDNVAEAVTRIGFRQTRSLVVGKGVMQAFTPKTQSVGFDRVECWRHALACAILAKQIAEPTAQVSTDVAFIAGLLHDVGKVLLDEFCAVEFEEAVHKGIQKHTPMWHAEKEHLQTTHVEVATQALKAWKFPDDVVDAVRFHHGTGLESAGLPGDRKVLCQTIYAANLMAKAAGIGHGGGDTFIGQVSGSVWDQLKLSGGLPKTFWTRFDKEFRECHSFLGITYEEVPGFVANRGMGLLHEEDPSPVSLPAIALESAGWTVEKAAEPGSLPKDLPARGPAFVIVRSRSAESLAAALKQWEPVAGTAPLIGLLPAGCVAPGERPCLVEPYDRDDLMNLLPQSAAASPSPLPPQ